MVGCGKTTSSLAPVKALYLWDESAPLFRAEATSSVSLALVSFSGRDLLAAQNLQLEPAREVEAKFERGQPGSKTFIVWMQRNSKVDRDWLGRIQAWEAAKEPRLEGLALHGWISEWLGRERRGSSSSGESIQELGAALNTFAQSSNESSGPKSTSRTSAPGQPPVSVQLEEQPDWRRQATPIQIGESPRIVILDSYVLR